MSSLNPYLAPATPTPVAHQPPGPAISLWRIVAILAGSAGICAAGGGLIGLLIGWLLPDYYHAVFGNSGLNTLQVGLGLGLTQGLGTGLVIGVVIVIAVAISLRRRS